MADSFVGRSVQIETNADDIFEGYVKSIDQKKKMLVLQKVKDCNSNTMRRGELVIYGEQIKNIKLKDKKETIDNHGEKKGKKLKPPDKDLEVEEPDEKQVQQKVILDAIDDVPALLPHSQHNDPSLYFTCLKSKINQDKQPDRPSDVGSPAPCEVLMGYDQERRERHKELKNPPKAMYINEVGDTFYEAIKNIKENRLVAVSIEGKTISRFGEISLVVVGTRLKVYLFDAHVMEKKCFDEGLRDLLENQNILKVMHDVRMVSDCLYWKYGIRPTNIFDTQVADAFIQKQLYDSFPSEVASLTDCVVTYLNISPDQCKFEETKSKILQKNPNFWNTRPFPREFFNACAEAAMYLRELRTTLLEKLLVQFLRGIDIYLDCKREKSDSVIKYEVNLQYLPNEILEMQKPRRRPRQYGNDRKRYDNEGSDDSIQSTKKSVWDDEFTEKYHERHGQVIECMDSRGTPPLLDTSKPLLKKSTPTKQNETVDSKGANIKSKPVASNQIDKAQDSPSTKNERQSPLSNRNKKRELSDVMNNENRNSPPTFQEFQTESNGLNGFWSEKYKLGDSDTSGSDYGVFMTSVNDLKPKNIVEKRSPDTALQEWPALHDFQQQPKVNDVNGRKAAVNDQLQKENRKPNRPVVSNAAKRMIKNALRDDTKGQETKANDIDIPDKTKADHVHDNGFNTEDIITNHEDHNHYRISKAHTQILTEEPTTKNKSEVTKLGRGRWIHIPSQNIKKPGPKLKSPPAPTFGKRNIYDFPSDDELLETSQIAPMSSSFMPRGTEVNVVKKYR